MSKILYLNEADVRPTLNENSNEMCNGFGQNIILLHSMPIDCKYLGKVANKRKYVKIKFVRRDIGKIFHISLPRNCFIQQNIFYQIESR